MDAMQRSAQKPKEKIKQMMPDLPATKWLREIVTANVKAMPHELGTTIAAFIRTGFKDLRDWLNDPWQQQALAHTDEPGMPGVLTQMEVNHDKHPEMYEKKREVIASKEVKGKEIELG